METAFLILLVGLSVIASMLIKSSFERLGLTPIVGYLVLGFLIHASHGKWEPLFSKAVALFEVLALFGIICLLFRIGVESDLAGMRKQLRLATVVWIGNMLFSSMLGFVAAYFWLKLPLIPSLFAATALTATSIGIPLAVWREAGLVDTPSGELLLDVAEMDDISGVVLMALLIAVAPALESGQGTLPFPALTETILWFLFKALGFGAFCFLFSRYWEKPVTDFFRRIEPAPDPMLMVAAVGFVIAALAEMLGFSLAIGAFFAGLTFSRDPDTVRMTPSFSAVYDFFTPFFFIGVGLMIEPWSLFSAMDLGVVLLGAAVVGKIVGTSGPLLPARGGMIAALIGISMVPRAEIAMIVMQRGSELGEWAVPSSLFGAMVLVSAVTCIFVPLFLRPLLKRWLRRA